MQRQEHAGEQAEPELAARALGRVFVAGGGVAYLRARANLKNLKGDNPDQEAGIKIILRALAKRREDRFATAAEMQFALEDLARSDGMVFTAGTLSRYLCSVLPESRLTPIELCHHIEQLSGGGTQSNVPPPEPASSQRHPRGGC